jgi:hypothetical protein
MRASRAAQEPQNIYQGRKTRDLVGKIARHLKTEEKNAQTQTEKKTSARVVRSSALGEKNS